MILCLALLAAPLLLIKASIGRAATRLTAAHSAPARPLSGGAPSDGYGVPDGILTSADLAATAADGVTASGAAVLAADAAQAGLDASPGAPAVAYIASVSPAQPVSSPTSGARSSPPSTSPPTTSPPPTDPPTTSPPTTRAPTTTTTRPPPSNTETGPASWYQAPAGTCAHPTLAFGTVVTVENLANGATTTCRVEDRGPYQGGRIIDLSEATFSQIASTSDGVIQVRISW
ncbi:MAG TPA: septal ring lytic transglycosylase RlpA family protein [Acidimicrobiales bacterium]|nr:septal ring lytic transglycosylase RlpA family protein [Acidimicrobiales bacterium]